MTFHKHKADAFTDPPAQSLPRDRSVIRPVRPAPVGLGHSLYRDVFKRCLDILYVLLAAPVVLPVILLVCALVALDGANPFYSQFRVGKDGRAFRMWKLRSMVPGAEAKLASVLDTDETARAEWSLNQKLASDPRITRIGRVIRATSLDELPQLFNVLTGDMSLVGPRPIMVDQTQLYEGRLYYALRPGLTGPWQVSARSTSTFAERVRFDDSYARDMGFWLDTMLIAKTVKVVFCGTGR